VPPLLVKSCQLALIFDKPEYTVERLPYSRFWYFLAYFPPLLEFGGFSRLGLKPSLPAEKGLSDFHVVTSWRPFSTAIYLLGFVHRYFLSHIILHYELIYLYSYHG